MKRLLIQDEHVLTTYYVVILQGGRKDKCECGGYIQYLGFKKDGNARYRRQYNCFHIRWARKGYGINL